MPSGREQAAQCGPRELVLRLLRMAYSLCLKQEKDASGNMVPCVQMQKLGREFLTAIDALER